MRFLFLLVLIINLFLLNSCKKYVPAEAAFFIKPSLVSVTTNTTQGSGSHKITDLWLYVDGKFQGAYPTGNLLPIITKNEKVKISILAGIKNNGISGTRLSWVFYDIFKLDTLVENGKTIEIPIKYKYNSFTTFAWLENFDGTGFSLIKSTVNNSDTTWKFASPADSFEGKSAEVGLTGNALIAQVESAITYTLPQASSNVYLEINYKSNQKFEVGVLAGNETKGALIINPTDTWNKIYIQLANAVNMAPTASAHKIYFRMYKTSDNANPKMFLDNIKLVYL
ncbi:MAG: hypothetical protein Q7W45_15305 [Bacteroidota bacterium]|nr:hypothetical protein [Bacteroidota bacterium]MDP3147266.1 hypothetical protein [Bacteroidota bacterium]MDP3557360.1 hypothetical protein [Bacteroidota bacterium]